MSSVKRRIIIEEYHNGGYGVFRSDGKEIMGIITKEEVLDIIKKCIDYQQTRIK